MNFFLHHQILVCCGNAANFCIWSLSEGRSLKGSLVPMKCISDSWVIQLPLLYIYICYLSTSLPQKMHIVGTSIIRLKNNIPFGFTFMLRLTINFCELQSLTILLILQKKIVPSECLVLLDVTPTLPFSCHFQYKKYDKSFPL